MHATTVAVDLAKSVFQIAVADDKWNVVGQERLTRSQFERWFQAQGYETRVLPSTSPAYTLAFPRKVDLWRAAWPELSDSA